MSAERKTFRFGPFRLKATPLLYDFANSLLLRSSHSLFIFFYFHDEHTALRFVVCFFSDNLGSERKIIVQNDLAQIEKSEPNGHDRFCRMVKSPPWSTVGVIYVFDVSPSQHERNNNTSDVFIALVRESEFSRTSERNATLRY